jgi:hypothetical protein
VSRVQCRWSSGNSTVQSPQPTFENRCWPIYVLLPTSTDLATTGSMTPSGRSQITTMLTLGGNRRSDDVACSWNASRAYESARLNVVHGCLLPTWDKRSVQTVTHSVVDLESNGTKYRQTGQICRELSISVAVALQVRCVVVTSARVHLATDRLQLDPCVQKICYPTDRRFCSSTRFSKSFLGSRPGPFGD